MQQAVASPEINARTVPNFFFFLEFRISGLVLKRVCKMAHWLIIVLPSTKATFNVLFLNPRMLKTLSPPKKK